MTFNDGYRPYKDVPESYTGVECPQCGHSSLESATKVDFCTNPNCDYSFGYW